MNEIFKIECLGCGEIKGSITTHADTVGIHCSCDISASVDIEASEIGDRRER